jgi:hypothetical protein
MRLIELYRPPYILDASGVRERDVRIDKKGTGAIIAKMYTGG